MKNLRWKVVTILSVFVVFFHGRDLSDPGQSLRPAGAGLAPGAGAEARARPPGRRASRAAGPHRRGAADFDHHDGRTAAGGAALGGRDGAVTGRHLAHHVPGGGRAVGSRRRVPPHRRRSGERQLRPHGGRRWGVRVHDAPEHRQQHARGDGDAGAADDRAPRQRTRRGRAEHLAIRRDQRSAARAAAGRVRGGPRQGGHPFDGAAQTEHRRGGSRRRPRRRCCSRTAGTVPEDMEVLSGAAGAIEGTSYYLVRRVAAITGQDLRNARPTLDENGRPLWGSR
jgi:hypothetical protein